MVALGGTFGAGATSSYRFVARVAAGSFDGGQTDGDGELVVLDAVVDVAQDVGADDAQVSDGFQGRHDLFNG